MPLYAYKLLDATGTMKADRIEAASEEQARASLRSRGSQVVQLKLVSGGATPSKERPVGSAGVPIEQQAVVFRQMAILIRAGVSLTEAISGLTAQVKHKALQDTLDVIYQDLLGGATFSEAVNRHPAVFPKLASDMIAVAEAGGTLHEALERLAEHLESSADIQRKVKAASTYPMVVVVIALLTLVAMMTFILPRFLILFKEMKVELPLTTRMLMAMSQSTLHYWYFWLLGIASCVISVRRALRSPQGRSLSDRLVLKLPILGDLVAKIIITRTMTTLGTLLTAGVPMMSALETAAAAANNEVVANALKQAQADVSSGASITNSLRRSQVFPALVLQMVAAGEKSGELPAMLGYACEYYSKDIDAKLRSLTSIIEPILIVVLGAFVGFIALSIIVPIYSLVGGVH
ncbi:MAG: type II secretion system F family protein [Armatimonadetes bacterium]|nr:type II secretion system F family protein [Armatimonadota bacterium]